LKASEIAEFRPEAESSFRSHRRRKQIDMAIIWEIGYDNPVSDFNRRDIVANFRDDTNTLMA